MIKLKFLSAALILLIGMFFVVQSCQKESVSEITETSQKKNDIIIKKLTFQDLKKVRELDNSLYLIQNKLDINSKSEINADNGKLILLTDNIIQAVTDSISTYSFKVKIPTEPSSTFENFVIIKEKNITKYFLYKFRFNPNNSEDFPFDITCTSLDEDQIIKENFNDLNKYVYWTGYCLLDVYYFPSSGGVGMGYETIWCDTGGGGTFYNGYGPGDSSSSGDSSTSTNTGSDSSDSSGTSYNTGDVGSTGGGGSTSSSGNDDYIKPIGVNFLYQENILDALHDSGYYSIQAEEWVLENPVEAKALNKFLLVNNNSSEAKKFVGQAVEDIVNNNISLNDHLNNLVLFDSNDPSNTILNLQTDIIDCFDIENNALGNHTITLYIDQPIANSSETYTIEGVDVEVGHTFVSLEQTLNGQINTKTFGFYPLESVSPNNPVNSPKYCDDGGHEFDVSIKINISPDIFNNMIYYLTYLNNNSINYNLNSYNCSDFGLGLINMSGANIPDTYSTWSIMGNTLGGGTNPAALGQDIRNLSPLPSGTLEVNYSGGNAVTSTTCQ